MNLKPVLAAIIGKAMSIGAISIVAIALVAASGVTAENPGQSIDNALSSFSSPLIWLIAIAVMISRGLINTGLGARIGYYFISIFVNPPFYGFTLLPSPPVFEDSLQALAVIRGYTFAQR